MLLKQPSQSPLKLSRINQSTIINLIGIKCAQCNLIYPQDMIQQHLITHIQPKYLMPNQQQTGAKKLNNKLQLTQQILSIKSADIPSLRLQNLPRSEILRKDIKPPSQFGIVMHDVQLPMKKDLVSYRNDQRDLSSVIGVTVEKDQVERQRLLHGVGLDREETILGGRQEISLYKSNRLGGLAMTQRIKTEKKVNPYQQSSSTQSEKTKQYQILPIRDSLIGFNRRQQQPSQLYDQNLLVVNVRKHKQLTPRHESIITTSAKKPSQSQYLQSTASKIYTTPTKSNLLQLSQPNKTINHMDMTTHLQTQRSRFNHTHLSTTNQFQCEQCHGFYCQHCKSTIPPIYRPWNIDDIDPRVVQFYKEHVYKKQCVDCDKNLK